MVVYNNPTVKHRKLTTIYDYLLIYAHTARYRKGEGEEGTAIESGKKAFQVKDLLLYWNNRKLSRGFLISRVFHCPDVLLQYYS